MLQRTLDAGVAAGWLTADEIYGQDKRLRVWCEQHGLPYVLATRSNDTVATVDWRQRRVRALIAEVDESAWQRCSAGAGAHGHRLYDWARRELLTGFGSSWARWVLARRSIPTDPAAAPELAYYVCAGPTETTLEQLVAVAGGRWRIEECFQAAKNEAGLASYQVRDYTAWYRHVTLAMLAHAYLSATRATAEKGAPQSEPTSSSR
jgi:SRSO17 transposase